MAGIQYLTVQDMLWINHLVTGKVLTFDYATLEEATYFQYGYGNSTDVPAQAAKFLAGFTKLAPFPEGNEATGFVGFVAFLRANGHDLDLTDADAAKADAAGINAKVRESHSESHTAADMAALIREVFAAFPQTAKTAASAVA